MKASFSVKNSVFTFLFFFFLCTSVQTFAQTLKKGNLVGIHTVSVQLDPDVTMNQYKDYLLNKWIPASEKNIPEMKIYLVEGIRGAAANQLGFIFMFESDADRNKYFNADGSANEKMQAANAKIQDVVDEGNKLGTWSSSYTDWIVQ